MANAKPNFRDDINGLRAWAVVAVILYHFGVPGFEGGFIGVDVFFVISGFLMTGIVIKGLEQNRFSLLAFYMARTQRIVPALLALCSILLALGWFVLLPSDYKTLSTHAISSLGFFSNIKYWDEAGYFDVASHEKWLLHTWSLSVEWQFYLLLPLISWSVWCLKPGRNAQIIVLIAGLILSLAASIWTTQSEPNQAFFWLHTRAWEMLSGGLAYMYANRLRLTAGQTRLLEHGGLLLILLSVSILNSESSWPGWRAIFPIVATIMVIIANNPSFWTNNKIAQWMGDRSYSLYLWHWPVYVSLVYSDYHSNAIAVTTGLLVTLFISHFSYIWVEHPARRILARRTLSVGAGLVAIGVSAAVVPAVLIRSVDGFTGRFPPAVELAAAESKNVNLRREECHPNKGKVSPSCVHGGKEWGVITWGDSHVDAVISAVAAASPNPRKGAVQWSYSGCPPVPGIKPMPHKLAKLGQNWQCTQFLSWAVESLDNLPSNIPIVLIGRYAQVDMVFNEDDEPLSGRPDWYFTKFHPIITSEFLDEYAKNITRSACELARRRTVYMVRPIPEMGTDVPKSLSRHIAMSIHDEISIPIAEYRKRNNWIWAAQDAAREQCGIKILDPSAYLCDTHRCYGSKNGQPLYSDDNHLSEFGNKLLIPLFTEVYGVN